MREEFAASPASQAAGDVFAGHLGAVLQALEPDLLGLYWPHRSEFNAASRLIADAVLANVAFALPFTRRAPREMHYRAWDGQAPTLVDECAIPACEGTVVVPDVVLVPCVGFTAAGHRLGYGGGYFDRWLAAHPGVTAVGVAWSFACIDADRFAPEPHDVPLTLIVTEHGPV